MIGRAYLMPNVNEIDRSPFKGSFSEKNQVALARLGAAAIILWGALPPSLRDELLRVANADSMMGDAKQTKYSVESTLKALLAQNSGGQ
jgi:hypothetical protein